MSGHSRRSLLRSPLLGCRRFRNSRLRAPVAHREKAEQDVVPLRLKLRDGARADLCMNAVDELLLHLRGEHRRSESLPRSHHRAGKLGEEMLDAAGPAAEVI